MRHVINRLLTSLAMRPVLMDLGAQDSYPEDWAGIAPQSIYVGIGPEAKLLSMQGPTSFHQTYLLDKVVTDAEGIDQVPVYLTNDPIYSTLLEPKKADSTGHLDWAALLNGQKTIPSTTVNAVVNELGLTKIDWLRTNINGLDLRVYQSIEHRLRSRILALDTVFDLIDLWVDHGSSFVACQRVLDEGFWLSGLVPHGFVRMQPESLRRINKFRNPLDQRALAHCHRKTPGWVFARFFRTIDSLSTGGFSPRDHVLLWAFALADGQAGFAADVTFEYARAFGEDQTFRTMLDETLNCLTRLGRPTPLLDRAKTWLPKVIRRGLRQLLPVKTTDRILEKADCPKNV
jgi:hypothetical protein